MGVTHKENAATLQTVQAAILFRLKSKFDSKQSSEKILSNF